MEFASSILSSIFTEIGKYLVKHSIQQANYLLRFENNVEDLKKEDANLRLTKDRVQQEVEGAKRNTEEIEKDVENWLMDVDNILEEIQRLEDDIQMKKTFLCGQCPNWRWRYKLSKRAVKKTSVILKLQESGKFDRVSHFTTLPGVERPKDFISFKPTVHAFSQIMEAMKNDKINMIGLYGMGGVGKTTLAKVVGKEAREKKLFDEVVMVTVTQNPNIKNIQSQIADLIGFKLAEETEEARAQRLCLRLKNEKKTLLILDDVWEKLDLTIIGIPFGDDHKGCTILLTTRQQQVCISMECQERVRLDILNEEEGLILFRKHAVLPDGLVCTKLKILLLDGSYRVKVSNEFFEEMKTLKVASLSWIDLSVKSLQFLKNLVTLQLLSCRLSDISSIKKLAKLEILRLNGSGIFELPEELGELSKLRMLDITGCLQLIRIPINVIARLSQLEELYSFKVEGTSAERGNANLSELCQLNHLTLLSLRINVQPNLPKDFVLPTKLLRYCITVNSRYKAVSYPKSRTLIIEDIEATSLFAFKALYENVEYLELEGIKGCCQNIVPSIDATGLNELKRLSLSYFDELECIIDTAQQQDVAFSNLVDLSLRSVGLREICSGGRPPRGFLENLETLFIGDCDSVSCLFTSWVLIQRLRKLKEVNVYRCLELEELFQLEGLCYSKENPFLLSSLENLYLLKLQNLRYIWKGPTQQVSLQSLTVAKVEICDKLRYLFTLSLARSLLQLEKLKVRRCGSLEYIVEIKDGEGRNDVCFTKLLKGPTQQVSLQSLTVVEVELCDKLRYLFTLSLARNLLQLEQLTVEYCASLEHIVETKEGEENVDVMFPKLRILKLDNGLKNFINFFSEYPSLNLQTAKQNLEELKIKCGVQVLFQLEGVKQELCFPSLKVLELSSIKELECLCKGPTHLLSLPNLKRLRVQDCHRLRHIFSPSLARNLLQLEELFIWDCGELEYIVSIKAEENVGGGGGNDVMLPKLRKLQLGRLPNFIDFYSENSPLNVQTTKKQLRGLRHGLQNLEELTIGMCRVQVVFHLEGVEQELSLSSLKVLHLYGLGELECFCKGPTHLLSLSNLKKLSLSSCHRLRHIFSPSLARNFMQLEQLIIWDFRELEQIFIEDDAEYNQTLSKDRLQWLLLFPNLSSISIWMCDKLKSMFPVSMDHLFSLQNLATLKLDNCNGLTHLLSSTLARNLLQLKSLYIEKCKELEQIVVEDRTEDHLRLGLFPNISSISVKGCNKDEVDMTSQREMVLPQLKELTLKQLASLVNFCPVGYHFIFPSLSSLVVTECPKLTTRFSIDQNKYVHAEAKAPQTGKEDVDMEQSPPETTREIYCWNPDSLRKWLPPYIGK
ncbi:hypothetical protein EZV62_008259 [Acer yangbiense]|uniref:AAA+ ATPase domain-containing protein n=1 Tax=Acer yangbiense TaxID=1000413 RepID=A0A5C7ICV9_9ROSI|nr:hypothetical protein EZV62_008259 [Acer yangbiense]